MADSTCYRASTLIAIEKHWGRALYKRFHQIKEVLGSAKLFCRVKIAVRKYQGPQKVIAIWAINNFTAHRLLHVVSLFPRQLFGLSSSPLDLEDGDTS